jgi:hypothetical protein
MEKDNRNLCLLCIIKDPNADDSLQLLYEVPYNDDNGLVLRYVDRSGNIKTSIEIPKVTLMSFAIEMLKFIER